MIEIVYKDGKDSEQKRNHSISLPKNIRQIGMPSEKKKIYIEDYVMSYLNQMAEKNDAPFHAAILLGYIKKSDTGTYVFVSGAVNAMEKAAESNRLIFTDIVWTSIYDTVKQYFDSLEIVGWFYSLPGFSAELTEEMNRIHRENFAGNDKIFFLVDSLEKEENIFSFESGTLIKQSGYYIYYERNEAMQEYMISLREKTETEPVKEVGDEAIKHFREIIRERKEESNQKKMMNFMYASSTFLVLIVVAIGITMINNYDKMKNMEEALAVISNAVAVENDEDSWTQSENEESIVEEENQQAADSSDSIPVQNVEGQVEKEDSQETEEEDEANVSENSAAGEQNEESNQNNEESSVESSEKKEEDKVSEAASQPTEYTVKTGDTLASISKNYYGTNDMVEQICEQNGIEDGDQIFAGQKLILP